MYPALPGFHHDMDSLNETDWDVIIAGTGIQESLLALAFSRSGKKVLHVDKNDYYGGSDAALSLQDAEAWVKVNESSEAGIFRNASIVISEPLNEETGTRDAPKPVLSFSRAYSLALSPQLIYTRSRLLEVLVSAKVDQQLEFLAVGNWWIYQSPIGASENERATFGKFIKVPSGREDVFEDQNFDMRSKRALMKFLRFLPDFENQPEVWEAYAGQPFSEFLSSKFGLSKSVQEPILALSLDIRNPQQTTTSFALPRIARHLRSIGFLGPGFGAVIPKWGGLAEVAQIGCRASAVGGGVYTLGNGIQAIQTTVNDSKLSSDDHAKRDMITISLKNGDEVRTTWLIGSTDNIDQQEQATTHIPGSANTDSPDSISRSISITSAPVSALFTPPAEGVPPPAVAVAVFPPQTLDTDPETPPVYIMIHNSDTGECPTNQNILYATTALPHPHGAALLARATTALLQSTRQTHPQPQDQPQETPPPHLLWTLQYTQHHPRKAQAQAPPPSPVLTQQQQPHPKILTLPPPPLDLAFEDATIDVVERAWRALGGAGDGEEGFMVFRERGGEREEEDGGGQQDDDDGDGAEAEREDDKGE